MKRGLILIVTLIVFLGLGFVFFNNKVGDIRPALLPSKRVASQNNDTSKVAVALNPDASPAPLTTPDFLTAYYFATDLSKPRDLIVSPGGTLLVSDIDAGTVVALPDANQDLKADTKKPIITKLTKPHGLAFYQNYLLVATETAVTRYIWDEANITATLDKKLFDLPKGGRHFSRSLAVKNDGTLFVSLGSSCDVCFEKHQWLAAVISSTIDGAPPQLYALGLRNAPFITLHPATEELWGTEMGRDFLGNNLPPDEINVIQSGKHYGWPICYGNKVFDSQFNQQTAADCQSTEPAIFELPAHVAPLGLTFVQSPHYPAEWQNDLFVALHGSWNSKTPVGYKIVRLDLENGRVRQMEDVVTGFISGSNAFARPVDITFNQQGYTFVSDDKGGAIFVLVPTSSQN